MLLRHPLPSPANALAAKSAAASPCAAVDLEPNQVRIAVDGRALMAKIGAGGLTPVEGAAIRLTEATRLKKTRRGKKTASGR